MLNPKVMEAWITLVTQAMQGTDEAQEAFQSLSQMSTDADALKGWMARFMPAASPAAGAQPEAFEAWLEEWWRVMGVVPRSRYLELLEKCDSLQRRLKQAEETIKKLQAMLGGQDQQTEEAQKVLDLWNTMLQETLRTQTEWMRTWTATDQAAENSSKDDLTTDKADLSE